MIRSSRSTCRVLTRQTCGPASFVPAASDTAKRHLVTDAAGAQNADCGTLDSTIWRPST